jgi:hypothetical protein
MIRKKEETQFVTEERLLRFQKILITDLIKEERAMLHEALMESLENAKVYHQKETDRYIGALMAEWREESKGFHDYMKGIKSTSENHEERILKLEWAVN